MIILRNNKSNSLFDKKLEGQRILDYEISNEIPKDNISVTKDLKNFKVYLPIDYEFDQYEISDTIRLTQPEVRTSTEQEYDIITLSASKPIKETTFFKVLKKIIEIEGFVTIVEEDY